MEEEEDQEKEQEGMDLSNLNSGGNMKTATEGWEGSKRRGRCLHLQRDHRQKRIEPKERGIGPKCSKGYTCEQHIQWCYPQKWRPGRLGGPAGRDCLGLQAASFCSLRKSRDLGYGASRGGSEVM